MTGLRVSAALGLLLALAGCSMTGPATIEVGRGLYNVAVQQTDNEQLLLNLVRLRYSDTPFFLEVTSVSTNFTFTSEGDATAVIPSGGSSIFSLGLGGAVTENPTVTYTPVDGEQFVRELLTPIDAQTLLLMYNSGWGFGRIFRICVQEMNNVPNAPTGSGPTPERAPIYEDFQRVSLLLSGLRDQGLVSLAGDLELPAPDEEEPEIRVVFESAAKRTPEFRELAQILKLSPDHMAFQLTTDIDDAAAPDTIHLRTRSVLSSLFYLSHNVDVPGIHAEAGKVTTSLDTTGAPFDWDVVSGDLFQIQVAPARPADAYATIAYRDHWFYIDDSDLSSKATFALLSTLLMLQSRNVAPESPVLTLPVSR